MPLSRLVNRPCTITRRSPSDTTDWYGNPIDSETTVHTVCEAQPTRIVEPERAGEVSDEEWTAFFLPADAAALSTASAVSIDGLGKFEVIGRPPVMRNPRTRRDEYIEVRMRQAAGAHDVEGDS